MAKIDFEDLLDQVESILKAKLNEYIADVEAEKVAKNKGLKPTLAPIKDKAYYRQSWAEEMLTMTPAIYYGVESNNSSDPGNAVANTYTFFIEVIFVDSGQSKDAHRRMARYSRALSELAKEKFTNLNGCSRPKITELVPIAFLNQSNTSEVIKVAGIKFTTSLV